VGDRLQVETSVLREAGRLLRDVYGALSSARDTADVGSDVIAHGGLRNRVHDFGAGWDTSRTEIMKAIEGLGRSAEGAADAYEQIETELVGALEGAT
jgi:hypothetical protein